MKISFNDCEYCGHRFKTKKSLDEHECRDKKRMLQLKTLAGTKAYRLYNYWMKCKGNICRSKETFVASRFYTSFFKFVKFINNMSPPSVNCYIDFMVKENIMPHLWNKMRVFNYYLNNFDTYHNVDEQIKFTLKTISILSNLYECDSSVVISKLKVGDVIKLIEVRRISPWVFFYSDSYRKLKKRSNLDQRGYLDMIIQPSRIIKMSKENPRGKKKIISVLEELEF